jgi:hypothetical protein
MFIFAKYKETIKNICTVSLPLKEHPLSHMCYTLEEEHIVT